MTVVVYEPTLGAPEFFGSKDTYDPHSLDVGCNVIVTNRWSDEFTDVADNVFIRDLFKQG